MKCTYSLKNVVYIDNTINSIRGGSIRQFGPEKEIFTSLHFLQFQETNVFINLTLYMVPHKDLTITISSF